MWAVNKCTKLLQSTTCQELTLICIPSMFCNEFSHQLKLLLSYQPYQISKSFIFNSATHKDSLPNTTICKGGTASNSQTYFTPLAETGCTYQSRYSEHLNWECCHRENSVMIITDVFFLQCLVILEKENIGDIKQMLIIMFTFLVTRITSQCVSPT